ncbi:MAG: hypothetical protein D6743_01765, partial [Calditrichaeota bacterium]
MVDEAFLSDYQTLRDHFVQLTQNAEQILETNLPARLAEECRALREKIEQGQFNLVVMGQFKRGKSTLINALLGEALLPTAVVPLTSVVTVVRYGTQTEAEVAFQDGTRRQTSVEALHEFITERDNPKNQKGVELVEIRHPARILHEGVQLVDTPGVGSVFEHNTDVAYQFMPKADAVLFLITADPPISKEELHFLSDVREHAGKIFFLKNKIDHLSAAELEESLAFTRTILAENLRLPPGEISIYPISAKWAFEGRRLPQNGLLQKSGLPELQKALERFLMQEKGNLLLENGQRRLHNLLTRAKSLLELELKAISTPQTELAEKLERFDQHQRTVAQEKEDIHHLIRGGLETIMNGFDEEVKRFKKAQLPELETWLRERFAAARGAGVKELASLLENEMRTKIEAVFTPWRKQQEQSVGKAFARLAHRLSARANEVIDDIYTTAGTLFDVRIQKYEREEKLADEKFFYFKVGDEFSALEPLENLLTYGIATLVSKNVLLKKSLAALPPQVDK